MSSGKPTGALLKMIPRRRSRRLLQVRRHADAHATIRTQYLQEAPALVTASQLVIALNKIPAETSPEQRIEALFQKTASISHHSGMIPASCRNFRQRGG